MLTVITVIITMPLVVQMETARDISAAIGEGSTAAHMTPQEEQELEYELDQLVSGLATIDIGKAASLSAEEAVTGLPLSSSSASASSASSSSSSASPSAGGARVPAVMGANGISVILPTRPTDADTPGMLRYVVYVVYACFVCMLCLHEP